MSSRSSVALHVVNKQGLFPTGSSVHNLLLRSRRDADPIPNCHSTGQSPPKLRNVFPSLLLETLVIVPYNRDALPEVSHGFGIPDNRGVFERQKLLGNRKANRSPAQSPSLSSYFKSTQLPLNRTIGTMNSVFEFNGLPR